MDKQGLINFLVKNKKTDNYSWDEIAKKFNFRNGENARCFWKNYRIKTNRINKIENKVQKELYIKELEDEIINFTEDFKNQTGELTYKGKKPIKTKEDLIKECNIDTKEWNIDRMICNTWGNPENQNYQVKAWLSKIKGEQLFNSKFIDFLKTYKPSSNKISFKKRNNNLENACLIVNKQDEHLNKYDQRGQNDIEKRMANFYSKLHLVLDECSLNRNLEEIIYVIGSDEFNSEWTNMTTKGTPQENILSYEDAFEKICNYEIDIINILSEYSSSKVKIVYIQGNHDIYVGWHLAHFLKSYFSNTKGIEFDIDNIPTKCIRYSNTAMMFNHGDVIKPEKLVKIFPMEFKDEWSACDNYYIFTGDKHFEKSEDYNGIIFYQLPSLSSAKSKWDLKNGYCYSKPELSAFLIIEGIGRTNIYKQPL